MAGLLRKLAGLVLEFPDDKKAGSDSAPTGAKGGSKADADVDPLAAIEAIRADLESSTSLDPKKLDEAAAEADPQPRAKDGSVPASAGAKIGGLPAEGGSGIRLPLVLNIKQVYEKAELPPVPGGFDLDKITAMLADPEIADLPLEVRARSVKMAVKSAGGELKEVLADAARRDQALEVYLNYLSRKVEEVQSQVQSQNAGLEQEIQDFITARRAIIESNKAKLEAAQQALANFSASKQSEEQLLFDTVAPFVAPGENPVVVSSARPHGGAAPKE